jgi:peroxiredoxin
MQPAGEVAPGVTEAAAPLLEDVTDEVSPAPAEGPAVVGSAAPEFRLQDQLGRAHSLSDFRGSPVVLEWFNHGCPFVKKHYGTDNMQGLQRRYTEQGVVWLSICSSAEGKQGFTPQAGLAAMAESNGMASTAVMADADGAVGRLYGARNTPHMFVIDAAGTLVYAGAIDDDSSASKASVEGAYNYVAATLDALLAGDPVEPLETQPYGCGVKY